MFSLKYSSLSVVIKVLFRCRQSIFDLSSKNLAVEFELIINNYVKLRWVMLNMQQKDLQTKPKLENDEVCFPGQIILFRIKFIFL